MGHNSYITRANKTNVTFIKLNHELFSDLLRSDPLIGAKFIYSIDLANQTYLRTLGDISKHINTIPQSGLEWAFNSIHNNILSRQLGSISLPSCIVEVKTKPKTTDKRKAEEQQKPAAPKT